MSPDRRIAPEAVARVALRAFLLTVGFYAAIATVELLLFLFLKRVESGPLAILGLTAMVLVIVSTRPRQPEKNPRLLVVRAKDQPRLFEKIQEIAELAGRKPPREIILVAVSEVVFDRTDGFLGIGRKWKTGIGLPLFLLDTSEFCAVIAHEYGHYHTSSWFTRWMYTKRRSVVRLVLKAERLSSKWVVRPFKIYARKFLQMTYPAARQIEYDADAFAVAVAGAPALIGAMQKLEAQAPLLHLQRTQFLDPAMAFGYRLPIFEGMQRVVSNPRNIEAGKEYIARRMGTVDPMHLLQPHPAMRDRIRAIEALESEAPALPPDAQMAVSLLDNLPEVEKRIYDLSKERGRELTLIGWDEVGPRVVVQRWTKIRNMNHGILQGWNIERVPEFLDVSMARSLSIRNEKNELLPPEQLRITLLEMISACVGLVLVEAGCVLVATPDEGVSMVRADGSKPVIDLTEFQLHGDNAAERWREGCDEAGVTGTPLMGRAAAGVVDSSRPSSGSTL